MLRKNTDYRRSFSVAVRLHVKLNKTNILNICCLLSYFKCKRTKLKNNDCVLWSGTSRQAVNVFIMRRLYTNGDTEL